MRGRKKSTLAEQLGRPMSSTERSRLRRARIKAQQAQAKALKSEQAQREALQTAIKSSNIPTAEGGRPTSRKYHVDRPATAQERKQAWKERQQQKKRALKAPECNNCGHVQAGVAGSRYEGTSCHVCKQGKYINKEQEGWKIGQDKSIKRSKAWVDRQRDIKTRWKPRDAGLDNPCTNGKNCMSDKWTIRQGKVILKKGRNICYHCDAWEQYDNNGHN